MTDRAARIAGGLHGLLVGDALGVPYEFHDPEDLPALARIEMDPPDGFDRAHAGIPPGTWSDDGAQALCLLASLLECGRLDAEDLGRRLLAWRDRGYMAVGGRVFDVGITTSRALERLRSGVTAPLAGPASVHDNGNGSLMRVLPLALWHQGSDAQLIDDACLQSRVTHGHDRSLACCAFYCLWARRALGGAADPWKAAVAALRAECEEGSTIRHEVEAQVRPDEPASGTGTGYVVDCLNSARWAVERGGDFETTVKLAVALGHDTDTTACVAGGIAGIREGIDGIPDRWTRALRGRELLDPLLDALLRRAEPDREIS